MSGALGWIEVRIASVMIIQSSKIQFHITPQRWLQYEA
jgi:hypothetical protein